MTRIVLVAPALWLHEPLNQASASIRFRLRETGLRRDPVITFVRDSRDDPQPGLVIGLGAYLGTWRTGNLRDQGPSS